MPDLPNTNNDSSIKDLYQTRTLYDDLFEQEPTQMDLWYVNPYYGKVNEKGEAVMLNEGSLKYISDQMAEKQNACIHFAARSFLKMKQHYEVLYKQGIIYRQSEFFGETLKDTKGWESPRAKYEEYIQTLFDDFFEATLAAIADNIVIKNFDDFVKILLDYLEESRRPFTRKGYLESTFNPISTTGLCIEIFEGEYDDDETRFKFAADENFDILGQLCAKYGFKIDRNIPWRLIADIQVKAMQNYILDEYTPGTTEVLPEKLFETFYEVPDLGIYFNEFKDFVKSFYLTFRQIFPTYKTNEYSIGKCEKTLMQFKNRQEIPNLNNLDYLKFFYEIRLRELDLKVPGKVREFHTKNITSIYNSFTSDKVEKVVEYIKYNLGTVAYRHDPVSKINLQRENKKGIITSQNKFDAHIGEDISYL